MLTFTVVSFDVVYRPVIVLESSAKGKLCIFISDNATIGTLHSFNVVPIGSDVLGM